MSIHEGTLQLKQNTALIKDEQIKDKTIFSRISFAIELLSSCGWKQENENTSFKLFLFIITLTDIKEYPLFNLFGGHV